METRAVEAEKQAFLEQAGATATPHSKRTLFDHLLGVRTLLEGWRARPALLDAGLFHSLYGTELYEPVLVDSDRREGVRALIGPEAEHLVHLWCAIRRRSLVANRERREGFTAELRAGAEAVPLTEQELTDLVTLWAADTLEQVDRLGGRTHYQPELYALRGLAPAPARLALERVFADRPFAKSP
jgi:hypothetical protein